MKPSPSYFVTVATSTSRDVIRSSTSETQRNTSAHTSLHALKESFVSRIPSKISSQSIRPPSPTSEENIPSSSLPLITSEPTPILAPGHNSVHLPVLSSFEGARTVISKISIVVTRTLHILPSTKVSGKYGTDANSERNTLHHSSVTLWSDSSPIEKTDKISKAVDAILPILFGSDDGSTANEAMDTKQKQRLKQRAAVANLVRWILSLFHIEMN